MKNSAAIVAALSEIELVDSDEQAVRLNQLWQSQTACLLWVRHFG